MFRVCNTFQEQLWSPWCLYQNMTKVGPILAISSILLTGQLSSLPKAQNTMPPLVHLEIAARLKTDQILPGLYLLILAAPPGVALSFAFP